MLRTHETEIHSCLLLLSSFDPLLNEIRQIVLCCTLACISTLRTHLLTFLLIVLCEWFCLLFFPFCPSCLDSKSSGTMRYRFQCYNQKALGFSSGVRLNLLTRAEYCFFARWFHNLQLWTTCQWIYQTWTIQNFLKRGHHQPNHKFQQRLNLSHTITSPCIKSTPWME